MNEDLSSLLFALVGGAIGIGLFYYKNGFKGEPLKRMRASTELVFKRIKVDSSAPEFSLYGRTAKIVKVDEEVSYAGVELVAMALHIYARNPQGEYFYVMAKSYGDPFVRHISHASAKAILKEKYVAVGT